MNGCGLWASAPNAKKGERYGQSVVRKPGGAEAGASAEPEEDFETGPGGEDTSDRRASEAIFFQLKDGSDYESEEELEEYDAPAFDSRKVLDKFGAILAGDCGNSMQLFRECVGQFLIQQEELAAARQAKSGHS